LEYLVTFELFEVPLLVLQQVQLLLEWLPVQLRWLKRQQ
jgi:hypothetical protein